MRIKPEPPTMNLPYEVYQWTHIEARVGGARGVEIAKDAFEGACRGEIGIKVGVLPVGETCGMCA